MALNFSRRPLFPSEDKHVSPMRTANGYLFEGRQEYNGDSFYGSWHSNGEIGSLFDFGRDKGDRYGCQDSVSNDILDLLPSDPFGMDVGTTFTAITGWLEVDYGGFKRDEVGKGDGSYQLFADLNFIWNEAMRFQNIPSSVSFEHKTYKTSGINVCSKGKDVWEASSHENFVSTVVENISRSGDVEFGVCNQQNEVFQECGFPCDGVAMHTVFNCVIGYLGLRDLLAVENVCKSWRSTVHESYSWSSVHIDQPLNEKITDDALLQLTNRARGDLQCLRLTDCPWITDDGLKCVLEKNPRLTKLCVPGCTRLSIEGIVNTLKAFNGISNPGVKHLRIGGLYGVTQRHFEELKLLLGVDDQTTQKKHKPHFYHRGNFYLTCEDDRAIDIEVCPRCEQLKLVYDCPLKVCQGKEHITQVCRGCTICIARCVQCGRCIYDNEYEETFSLEWICSDCGKQKAG